jgi:predicted nucleotidyltransferase
MEGEDAVSVELDMFGWDVDKALGLLRESNPALLDWFAPEPRLLGRVRHHLTTLLQAAFADHLLRR